MPRGDEKHKLIYDELVNVLGPDHVSDDPAVMEAHSRGYPVFSPDLPRFEFVVLPGSSEDVQQIVKLANRYKFPFSTSASGLLPGGICAVKPYWCYIDPKRMNHLEIDEKNMYAVVESYVSIAQVQAEAMKRGLFCGTTGASTTGSAMSTNLFQGIHWTSWRTGTGRSVLGVEWVLPTGDILKTGSLAIPGAGYCWGEGPGPDARGILRGHVGHGGALGIVTRLALKLFPWPGPSVWPTEGIQPEKKSILPPERFKSYFINYSSLEKTVEVVREIGKAEIAGWVLQFAPWDFTCWAAKSREEWWQLWESEYWTEMKKSGHMVAVGLWGFASEKQLKYEEKVLKEIIEDTGGELVPEEQAQWMDALMTPNTVRDTYRCRFLRVWPFCLEFAGDSLEDLMRSVPASQKIRDKYTPPLGPMGRDQHKYWPGDFGRVAFQETDTIGDRTDECLELEENIILPELIKKDLDSSTVGMYTWEEASLFGPAFSNYHLLLGKIKKSLDPNNVANPTRLIDMEKMEKEG